MHIILSHLILLIIFLKACVLSNVGFISEKTEMQIDDKILLDHIARARQN